MSKSTEQDGKKPLSRSLRIYQKLAITFVILSFLLLLFVLYLSVSSATIRVTAVPQTVNTQASVEIVPEAISDGQVSGYVLTKSFTQSRQFTLPQEGAVGQEAKAGGTVTLFNETGSNQPLVATTRLLSKEGVLFRLDSAVTIPAGGQIDALVHADVAGKAGDIGVSEFTIPGLATSLQSVIYAISVKPMTGGVVYVRELTQADLDTAVLEFENDILDGAKETLALDIDVETYDGSAFSIEVMQMVSDTELGAEVGTFVISVTADVIGVFYPKEMVESYMLANLKNSVSGDYQVVEVAEDGSQVEMRSVDDVAQKAILGIYLDGIAIISPTSDVLDKERLLGRSPDEVKTLLESSDLIEKIQVTFTPFWLKRVPSLPDHINIIVE